MSPEQARGQRDLDGRTDQFSLGVILYECTTGRRPFEGDSLYGVLTAIVEKLPERPSKLAMPEDFERLIMRALSKQPEGRFASATDLGHALLPFASARIRADYASDFARSNAKEPPPGAGQPPLLDSAPGSLGATRRRHARTAIAGSLCAFGLGAALLLHQTPPGAPIAPTASTNTAAHTLESAAHTTNRRRTWKATGAAGGLRHPGGRRSSPGADQPRRQGGRAGPLPRGSRE